MIFEQQPFLCELICSTCLAQATSHCRRTNHHRDSAIFWQLLCICIDREFCNGQICTNWVTSFYFHHQFWGFEHATSFADAAPSFVNLVAASRVGNASVGVYITVCSCLPHGTIIEETSGTLKSCWNLCGDRRWCWLAEARVSLRLGLHLLCRAIAFLQPAFLIDALRSRSWAVVYDMSIQQTWLIFAPLIVRCSK